MATKSLVKKNQAQVVVPLVDLVNARLEADARIKKLEEKLEPLKEAKKEINSKIIEEFKRRKEFSTRVEGATVSLSVRKTAVVVDEPKVITDLKRLGLTSFISERLSDSFDGVKKEIAAGEVELFKGMEINTSLSFSLIVFMAHLGSPPVAAPDMYSTHQPRSGLRGCPSGN